MDKLAAFNFNELEQAVTSATSVKKIDSLGSFFGGPLGLNVLFFFIAGALLLIYLIWGGISLMTSGGDPKKVAGAKETITHALIGMLIVFGAYWIVQIVGMILGLRGFGLVFG